MNFKREKKSNLIKYFSRKKFTFVFALFFFVIIKNISIFFYRKN